MAEADALRDWALSLPERPSPAATSDQLARHLDFMHAALPSRQNDTETGRKRFAVYASLLAGQSGEALAHMAREACATLDWFPTPRQCLELAASYRAPASERTEALAACSQFTHAAFEQWVAALHDGGLIGDVPERWLRIAAEQGALRRLRDGSYVNRATYQGPPPTPQSAGAGSTPRADKLGTSNDLTPTT